MDSMLLYLLFPSLFMIHEMEEILLMPSFMSSMVEHPKFKNFKEFYSPFKFNLIVFEEFLILLAFLAYSFYAGDFTIYQTIIIAYNYHIVIHVLQSLYLKKICTGSFEWNCNRIMLFNMDPSTSTKPFPTLFFFHPNTTYYSSQSSPLF